MSTVRDASDRSAAVRTTDTSPTTIVVTSLPELESFRTLWRSQTKSPFVDMDFFRFIVQCRGKDVTPFVVGLLLDGRPSALLVGRLERRTHTLRIGYAAFATVSVRQVTFLADGLIGDPSSAHVGSILEEVDRRLGRDRIALAVFEHVPLESSLRDGLRRHFGWLRVDRSKDATRHWRMTVPARWEEFLRARTSKHRYWLTHLSKALNRDFAGRWSISLCEREDQVERFLDDVEAVACLSYQRRLGAGFIRNDEYAGRVTMDARCGRLAGYVLTIDGVARAFWYCARYGDTLHSIATAFDPQWRRYEPGTVLLLQIVRDHCGTATASIDFGIGDALYKERFGSEYRREGSIPVFSSTPAGLTLHAFVSTLVVARRFASVIVDRLALTQQLKTRWRRRLVRTEPVKEVTR